MLILHFLSAALDISSDSLVMNLVVWNLAVESN